MLSQPRRSYAYPFLIVSVLCVVRKDKKMSISLTAFGADAQQLEPEFVDAGESRGFLRRDLFGAIAISLLLHLVIIILLYRVSDVFDETTTALVVATPSMQLRLRVANSPSDEIAGNEAVAQEESSEKTPNSTERVEASNEPKNLPALDVVAPIAQPSMVFNAEAGSDIAIKVPVSSQQNIKEIVWGARDTSLDCESVSDRWSLFSDCEKTQEADYSVLDVGLRFDFLGKPSDEGDAMDYVVGNFTGSGNTDKIMHMINSKDRVYRMSQRVMGYP